MKMKTAAANIALVANAFVWYLLAFNTLKQSLNQLTTSDYEQLLVFGVNAGAIVIAGLVGSFVVEKFKKRASFLYLWMLSGIFLSLIPLGLYAMNITYVTTISILFGAYFGFGMPATMGYHSASSNVGERAKIGGISFLIIGLIFAVVSVIAPNNLIIACLILAAIRIVGVITFYLLHEEEGEIQDSQKVTYKQIVSHRSFLLYFIPWIMFSIVNYTTIPIQERLFSSDPNFVFLYSVVENIIIAISAVTAGFIADRSGRKRLTIIGFILLGIGYATLGLLPISISGYFYVFADGTAWGIFAVILLLTVWGDLAQEKSSEKFYLIGALPYLFSNFLRLLFQPALADITETAIFSFASVFLFLAVLPLFYAPELLPEKVMKDRDLKSYIEKAKQKVQKEAEKSQKKDSKAEKGEAEPEETPEDAEARKLAEKYY